MNELAFTRAGLNLIQQGMTIYDSDLRLAVCNAPFAQMFDLPAKFTTPGSRFEDTIRHLVERGEYGDVGDAEKWVRDRVEIARAFEPHYMERTRANGRTISVEGAPLPQGGWVTVYTDITQTRAQEELLRTRSELLSEEVLKRSEELAATNRRLAATNKALEEARRELAEIEARTRATTQMMPAHIARLDAEGYYTFSNNKLGEVMPGRPASVIGLHISETLGPQAYARVRPHLEEARTGQKSIFEFTDDSSSRRIRAAFTPDPLEPGIYILSQDVTEETQTRTALQQTRRREIAAQLTSGLAHDFSNLLTIILGTQSRLARMDLGPEAEPLISATLSAARRGGRLLDRIADMTSQRGWQPRPLSLPAFLDELRTLATPSLPEGITLHTSDADAGGLYMVDPGLLQDALLNLVLNARDACGTQGCIRLTAREVQDTWLELSVEDSGPGFSEAALEHGLEPFFTTKGGEGSGLGLAMVYDMTKLSGGSMRIGNTPFGARVSLRLPLRRAEQAPVAETGLALLAEDSPDLREAIREMLTDLGFSVVEAASVEEACALAEGLPDIALVLSDISLEGDTPGFALAETLPHLPLRFMTSLPPDHPQHVQARRLGPVLPKPFSAADLAGFLGLAPLPASAQTG
ncbi:hybrid sensor histidine kinase/response regulator [Mameliella sediminis]|uniref:hybrid sensor histidine kinase/response regulator n=1 Tax=Mameliella sediminis TaxID=2836866 RepID=UPI001C453C4B|nr:PAS-domain containing protein [Mameliella sediminis]MBV7396103.1 PAS-domain containing protein [Mameliella sediminis]MBY6160514.1 PAS-domain containing protein [Mameliella alba]MBY6168984.1 PAS-domain containing protein [Mameliella alba]MBY6173795.1 PAS-domain containing protein [Mameliella alba]